MSTPTGSGSTASAIRRVAARLKAAADEAEEYRRGREDGIVWACDYATTGELRDLVENFEPGKGGDFDNPHWRGFVAGVEEVLDAARPT